MILFSTTMSNRQINPGARGDDIAFLLNIGTSNSAKMQRQTTGSTLEGK